MSDTQITSPSVSDIIHDGRNVGLVICVSDIIHDDANVGLVIMCIWHYYMMTQCWTRDLCIWTLYMMTQCWTRDLYLTLYMMNAMLGLVTYVSWHYTEWCWDSWSVHLTLLQNDAMLDSWSVHLTLLQNDAMLDSWSVYLTLYRMTPMLGPRDLCIWNFYRMERHVGTNDLFI